MYGKIQDNYSKRTEDKLRNLKYGMDESVWPDKIADNMQVVDYKMVRLNSWDVNFLGYLVVKYDDAGYKAEVERLKNYNVGEIEKKDNIIE